MQIFVGGHQQIESCRFCCIEQSAVRKAVPSAFNGFNYDMAFESVAQGAGVLWSNSMSIDCLGEMR